MSGRDVVVPKLENSRSRDGLVIGEIGHVGVLLLDRPERANSYDRAMQRAFEPTLRAFDASPHIRSIVLASTSRRYFSTGVDLIEAAGLDTPAPSGGIREALRLTNRHLGIEKPVVCAVEGVAAGGGLHFVVDAEIVVAGADATFLDPHVDVGFVSGFEAVGLAERIGIGSAYYLALAGRDVQLSADRAYQLGLVQEVVPSGQAFDRAMELATAIATKSPSAVLGTADTIRSYAAAGYSAAMDYGWARIRAQWNHSDSEEGPRAFGEKRPPKWADPPQRSPRRGSDERTSS